MSIKTRKIGIIGVGHVGSHVASSMITQGICDELVLIDTNEKKVESHAIDLADSVTYMPHKVKVYKGTYEDIRDADILVVSACATIFEHDRLLELSATAETIKEIAPKIKESGFNGIILSISNPCDIIAQLLQYETKLNVIGTGTALDSSRLTRRISDATGIAPKSIQAYCFGEHGDSQMVPWSIVTINGKPLLEFIEEQPEIYGKIDVKEIALITMKTGWHVVQGKGATEFGIGAATAELAKAIIHDERRVLPCSTMLNGEYKENGLYASVPCVIGKNGVEEIIEFNITDEEQKEFSKSCEIIKRHYESIKK